MRIAHLSDLHIDSQADVIYGVNPIDNLERAVSMLEKIQDIDAGIITGDISNDGEYDSLMNCCTRKSRHGGGRKRLNELSLWLSRPLGLEGGAEPRPEGPTACAARRSPSVPSTPKEKRLWENI